MNHQLDNVPVQCHSCMSIVPGGQVMISQCRHYQVLFSNKIRWEYGEEKSFVCHTTAPETSIQKSVGISFCIMMSTLGGKYSAFISETCMNQRGKFYVLSSIKYLACESYKFYFDLNLNMGQQIGYMENGQQAVPTELSSLGTPL